MNNFNFINSGARPGRVASGGPVRGSTGCFSISDNSTTGCFDDTSDTITTTECHHKSVTTITTWCYYVSVSGNKTEKGGASNTFQAYQASVSDAWDIEVRTIKIR